MPCVLNGLSGWSGVILALLSFSVALKYRSTALGLLAAVLSAPFCRFVNGYPIVGAFSWAALAGNFIAACVLRRRPDVAFAALTPFAIICVFLAVLAIRGITLIRVL